MKHKILDSKGATIGVLELAEYTHPTVEFKGLLPDLLSKLATELEDRGTLGVAYDAFMNPFVQGALIPEGVIEWLDNKPLVFTLQITPKGFRMAISKAHKEVQPSFEIRRVGEIIRVYPKNPEAMKVALTLMGNGGRAIIKGMSTCEDGIEAFYIEPECRPAGRAPEEMYKVEYICAACGAETKTCSREELLDYIENPAYSNLKISLIEPGISPA